LAFRGCEAEASQLIEAATRDVVRRREAIGLTFVKWATSVLYSGLGRYEDALAAAQQVATDSPEQWFSMLVLVELIEAATRTGNADRAEHALERLSETTAASGTDWAVGIETRSRALVSDGEAAETLYRQAIDALGPSRLRVELARAHLLYGEWLRRVRRRLDARQQLRRAYELFTEFGMEAFAERARVELEATGEHARKRTAETLYDLTPQEAQISPLAADEATNQQIAAQLFISPSTVDYHLRKAFRKLGVKSRTQLAKHLPQPGARPKATAREPRGRPRHGPALRVNPAGAYRTCGSSWSSPGPRPLPAGSAMMCCRGTDADFRSVRPGHFELAAQRGLDLMVSPCKRAPWNLDR
jgi:DNA-binding CsgD family transcriptional regulator